MVAIVPIPLQFGIPGGMELAVILLIAILLFGANKIPQLARSTGQAMGEFKRGREEIEKEISDLTGESDSDTEKEDSKEDSKEESKD
jgi:sec-independent protein translocase protein TatA